MDAKEAKPKGKNGGKRAGAGRPKGAVTKVSQQVLARLMENGQRVTPLEVLVTIMEESFAIGENGQRKDVPLAVEAATRAAPYLHPRLNAIEHSGPNGGPIPIRFDPIDGSL